MIHLFVNNNDHDENSDDDSDDDHDDGDDQDDEKTCGNVSGFLLIDSLLPSIEFDLTSPTTLAVMMTSD